MALSNSTLQKLSQALTSEVIDYIHSDDRFLDFLCDIVPDAITSILGTVDEDLKTFHNMSEEEVRNEILQSAYQDYLNKK